MWKIRTPTRYIYYDECTPQDTLPSSSHLFCYSFNTPHLAASKWQEETLGDPGAMLRPDPMLPTNQRDCSRKKKERQEEEEIASSRREEEYTETPRPSFKSSSRPLVSLYPVAWVPCSCGIESTRCRTHRRPTLRRTGQCREYR